MPIAKELTFLPIVAIYQLLKHLFKPSCCHWLAFYPTLA
ncbi:MAG: hypothetical protein OFPI_06450 [Osedax symbiont Rs2]|nr:MAG: hypothetical protein OFPI_06450 [Osedax symbiont Rs2]